MIILFRNSSNQTLLGKEDVTVLPYMGDLALVKAKAHNTPIVYKENGEFIEEYPNGDKIVIGKKQPVSY